MNSYTYFADFYIFAPSFYKKVISMKKIIYILKSASNLNDNLNCSKELEHYAS